MAQLHQKILVVDDEDQIRSMLEIFLAAENFEVTKCATGKDALRSAVSLKPDLILLDLGLPDMDGKDIITKLRAYTQTPIIVLTARTEDEQAVLSLNLGADDYVTKPFRAEILLARINANLRERSAAATQDERVANGPIVIDASRHEVRVGGQLVAFTPKEYDLLHFFVANRGRIVTHKQILKHVWGPSHTDDTQYLRVYIGQVRDKLESVAGLGKSIVSEPRIGYRMNVLESAVLQAAE